MNGSSSIVDGLPGRLSVCRDWLVLVVLALLLMAAGPLQGQVLLSPPAQPLEFESKLAAKKLLQQHWKRGLAARSSAATVFAQAPHDNPTVLLAYVLNRTQQGRPRQALEISQEINQRFPSNLDAWLLTAWHEVLIDSHNSALGTLRSLKQNHDDGPPLEQDQQRLLWSRIGRLIGYLEGPVRSSVNQDLLDATKLRLKQQLSPLARQSYLEGINQTDQQFRDLSKLQADAKQQELKRVKVANQLESEQLAETNAKLEQTESRLTPQADQLRQQGLREISDLEQQASSWVAQLEEANANVFSLEQELSYAWADWNWQMQQPPRFRMSTWFLENRINVLTFQLSQARSRVFTTANQLASTRDQIARANQRYGNQLASINREVKRVEIFQRRNQQKLNRLARGPKIADGKQEAMDSKLTALKTYDDLSLELYRLALLDAIK